MTNMIEKDLLSYLLKLEVDQQKQVLTYVKELLEKDRLNKMADESEKAIAESRVLTMEEFKSEADKWVQKRPLPGNYSPLLAGRKNQYRYCCIIELKQ